MATTVGLPMPQPGETITEGVVVRWIKQVGDLIAEKEPVVELETAKAVYEYESPLAGKIVKIITPVGDEQKVGQPLAWIECDEAAAKKYLRLGVAVELDASGQAISGAAKIGATVGSSGSVTAASAQVATATGGQLLPPLIRTLAKEQGIPESVLATLTGTGPGGKLTKDDLLRYATVQSTGAAAPSVKSCGTTAGRVALPPPLSGSKRVEPTPIRRRIAENMILAKSVVPHAGSTVEVDMTDLLAWREQTKAAFEQRTGAKFRLGGCFLYAVREALKKFPTCNNFYFVDESGKHWIEEHAFMNLGMAVGTERGLIVPVLKGAEQKDFSTLARESDLLIKKAVAGKLMPDDLVGATVTINNPGALGSVHGNQILSYPQSVILGFQAVVERACFVHGACVPRQMMLLTISFDHRLVDGVEAVGLLNACKAVLEAPQQHFANERTPPQGAGYPPPSPFGERVG
ncbi:MAG: 2-oxo acid dehydrogenase subunit E2 [Deltaproteobacteria bacterium]|nr:2-oxo acid dehydrogenase subunit E2 [Deltaproteobacteria bacterium]